MAQPQGFLQGTELKIGLDVSAKYRGAWCEGTIKKVETIINCKVGFGTFQYGFLSLVLNVPFNRPLNRFRSISVGNIYQQKLWVFYSQRHRT